MKLFKWEEGRQLTGYYKMPLVLSRWPIPFDWHLVGFPEDSFIDAHTDPIDEGKHFRLNIELKKADFGGYFLCDAIKQGFCKRFWRFTLFRPDLCSHSVSRVEGTRLILSIGWIWPY